MAKKAKKADEKLEAEVTALAIVLPKAKAMQTGVGPQVAAVLAGAMREEADAKATLASVKTKSYDALSSLTAAMVKAALADKNINLAAAFGDGKAVNSMNDILGLALGIREVVTRGEGAKAKQVVVTAKAMADLFPMPGESKDDPIVRQKTTFRSNFLHTWKKCAQAAEGIIQKDIKIKTDADTGTLRISGPAVKATFGQDSVLLNEKQTIGEGDDKIKLKARPSFTEVARMGAIAHGKEIRTRVQSGIAHAGGAVDSVLAFVTLSKAMVDAINKLGNKPDAKCVAALKSVESAIDKSGLT